MEIAKDYKKIVWIMLGAFAALMPSFLIRCTESVFMFFYNKFTTYPGDLWNFYFNYLRKGMTYPPEYPAGLRFFYEAMGFYKYESYELFFTVNFLILAGFALATAYVLHLIIKQRAGSTSSIWYFWILAPSLIFYGTINYDLPVIFLIVLAVYLFLKEKFYFSIFILALGTVLKVFPVFLLPLFLWRAPREKMFWMAALFGATVLGLNLPYMLSDFGTWIFPYTWQISSNLTTGPGQGTYWWMIYPLTGKFTGWLSLALFGGLYLFICRKMRNASFTDLGMAVILIFLLTDRIFSPQYILYLLPFLVLANYSINKKVFYTMDLLNVSVVFFLFFLREHVILNQIIVHARYALIIALLVAVYRNSRKQNIIEQP